jgi:hypothetical protein
LTAGDSSHVALYIVLAGIVLALVVVLAGAARLVVQSRALKKRLDGVAELPFLPTLDLTLARLDIASRAYDTVPELEARTVQALAELQAARLKAVAAVAAVPGIAEQLFWKVLIGPGGR